MKNIILFALIFLYQSGSCAAPENSNSQSTASAPSDNPMIHASGTKFVDGTGKPIKLRGVILEGWLHWNGPLWGTGLNSETDIAKRLEEVVGKKEVELFRNKIYENFITEDDIAAIAKTGFNVVRIPFNHTILEDDAKPFVYKDSGWRLLDRVLDWCEKNKVYAVLDMHSVPGGQSGMFVNDPGNKKIWESEEHMKRTVALWKEIAKRYRDREIVAGYDLMNEPGAPNGKALIDAYRRIIKAVREVDKNHMVILEGGEIAATDFSMFKEKLDANQVLSFHSYNFLSDDIGKSQLADLTKLSNKLDVPLWNGEFGAHKDTWLKEIITVFEQPESNINGWIFWPWKNVGEDTSRREISSS